MDKKIQEIKEEIAKIDSVLIGTLSKRYKSCGRKNCRCMAGKEYWHGPYFIWTRKEKGKTITKTLNKNQAQYCQKAFRNMKLLNRQLQHWKKFSLKSLDNIP